MKKIRRVHCPNCGYVVHAYDIYCPSCRKNLKSDGWYLGEVLRSKAERKRRKVRKVRIKKIKKINELSEL